MKRNQASFDTTPKTRKILDEWRKEGRILSIHINVAIEAFDAALKQKTAKANARSK